MGDIQCQPELTYRQNHEFTTRHITPQICVSAGGKSTGSSAATSRTTSRLSGASSIQVNVIPIKYWKERSDSNYFTMYPLVIVIKKFCTS